MKKIKQKKRLITIWSFVFLIGNIICLSIINNQYVKIQSLQNEVIVMQNKINIYEDETKLFQMTKDFIDALSQGNHEHFLTGEALTSYENALKTHDTDNHGDEDMKLKDIEFINVYVTNLDQSKANANVLYRADYIVPGISGISENIQTLIMSMKIDWQRTMNGFKVSSYEVTLLQDSLDQYIKESYEKGEFNE